MSYYALWGFGVTKSVKGNGVDITLKDLVVGTSVPKSGFVLLIILYAIATFFVRVVATNEGSLMFFGREVPFSSFPGVFSSLGNICMILMALLYRKLGYFISLAIMFIYQFPTLIIQFFVFGNESAVSGVFSNLFTLVTITIIYVINNKNLKYQQRVMNQAITDRLTGLPNRFAVGELCDKLIGDQVRFTFLSIDIVNFKSINDTMGHEFGDKLLIEIANRWRSLAESGNTGTNDFVGRLGGDEFCLIIRDYKDVEQITHTLYTYKAELERVISIEECDYFMTANFGYAVYPKDGVTTDQVISGANAAMHVALTKGDNGIMGFDPDLVKDTYSLEIERKIRTALDNQTITFNLQPQYDIGHRLRGFEALARMKDEEGNNISPVDFIPVAEKTGLVDQIDSRVFELAVKFVSDVINETLTNITMSVNVSVRHLMKNNFIKEITGVLEKYNVPPHCIEIEITESIMIDSTEKALNTIGELKDMGIKIAIDDFGTGYSSLSYLNHLPSDLLKIDKSFIDVMNDSDSSKQYVAMIVSIGHIMNLKVISEGVESADQVETLKEIGCDYIQGFVWGRPMTAEDAMKLVLEVV
jgi:diguanylate cyclase (GGDEF)-like protein